MSLSSPVVPSRNARLLGLLGGGFLGIFAAHSLAATAELLAVVPPWLTALNAFLLPLLNVCFTLGFTWVGFATMEYLLRLRSSQNAAGLGHPTYLLTTLRKLGPLYALCLLIGFGLEPLLAAVRHVPYHEPARLSWYLLGLSNFDKLRIQPTSWVLAELWAVAVVGQWLGSGLLLLWLKPRRWWVPLLGLMLAGSVGFQLIHASEWLVLKLHSGAIFTDFTIGSLFAIGAADSRASLSAENARNRWRALRFAAVAGLLILALVQRQWLAVPLLASAYRVMVSSVCGGLILASFCDSSPKTRSSWAVYGLNWLGRRTYTAYCLHTAAISLTAAFLTHLPEPAAWLLAPISLLLTVGFARVWGRLERKM